jgi:saccharopine dehydrogenase-like NADP-dependent oxidoreductase
MFRGTLRYQGWCACLKKVVELGLLDETPVTYAPGTTYARWVADIIGASTTENLRRQVAQHLNLDESSNVLERLEWLGLFSSDDLPVTGRETTRLDVLAARMGEKMPYKKGERDMIVLVHQFVARFPDKPDEKISSTLIDFGQPDGDSSMSRTVSLPAAVGAKLVLTGQITDTGVHIPVKPSIYNPVLNELENMGIRCEEKTAPAAD